MKHKPRWVCAIDYAKEKETNHKEVFWNGNEIVPNKPIEFKVGDVVRFKSPTRNNTIYFSESENLEVKSIGVYPNIILYTEDKSKSFYVRIDEIELMPTKQTVPTKAQECVLGLDIDNLSFYQKPITSGDLRVHAKPFVQTNIDDLKGSITLNIKETEMPQETPITIAMTAKEYKAYQKAPKTAKVLTDLENALKFPVTLTLFDIEGTHKGTDVFKSEKKALKRKNELLQNPANIGYTVVVHSDETRAYTTSIPIIEN